MPDTTGFPLRSTRHSPSRPPGWRQEARCCWRETEAWIGSRSGFRSKTCDEKRASARRCSTSGAQSSAASDAKLLREFEEENAWESDKYARLQNEADFDPHPGEPKTLNHLACEDRWLDERGCWVGVEALMTLKGDVDNLGAIFQSGLSEPTFARMAALSRQLHAFFAVYLPALCQSEAGFRNTYTVFAGGDDFFLVGPWRSQIQLAARMRNEFQRYVAGNPGITFSAGLTMTKPGLPVRALGELAEDALERAKGHDLDPTLAPAHKNAVSCFGETVGWNTFTGLLQSRDALEQLARDLKLRFC